MTTMVYSAMALLSILLIASVPMTQGSPLDGNEVPTCSGVGDNGKCAKNDEHVTLLQSVVNVHTRTSDDGTDHAHTQVQNGMEFLGEMEDEDEVQGPRGGGKAWTKTVQTCNANIRRVAGQCQRKMEKRDKWTGHYHYAVTKWCGRLKSMCLVCEQLCTDDPDGNKQACGRKSDYCTTSTQNWLPSCQGGGPTGTAYDMVSDGSVKKENKCMEGFHKPTYVQVDVYRNNPTEDFCIAKCLKVDYCTHIFYVPGKNGFCRLHKGCKPVKSKWNAGKKFVKKQVKPPMKTYPDGSKEVCKKP